MNAKQRRKGLRDGTITDKPVLLNAVTPAIESVCYSCLGRALSYKYSRRIPYHGSVSDARSRSNKVLVYTECQQVRCGAYRTDDSVPVFDNMQQQARVKAAETKSVNS